MQYLRQNAAVKVVIGPVVAVGDGFTPVTTLDLSTADEAEIIKHDASAVTDISGGTLTAITNADGYYNLSMIAGYIDTVGMLTVLINDDSLCLPVLARFHVIEEYIYDALFAANADAFDGNQRVDVGRWNSQMVTNSPTGKPDVNVNQIGDTESAANNLEAMYDGAGYAGGTIKLNVDVNSGVHVWHVAKTGNDGNGGHSFSEAKLTVQAAVTAAANGDTIIVWPGDYAEADIDLSAKSGITIKGIGWKSRIVKADTDYIIKLGDDCRLENIAIENTQAAGANIYAVYANTKSRIHITGCYVKSNSSAVYLIDCVASRIKDSHIIGAKYGLYIKDLATEETTFVDRCCIAALDWTGGTATAGYFWVKRVVVTNSAFDAYLADTSSITQKSIAAIFLGTRSVVVSGCGFRSISDGGDYRYGIDLHNSGTEVIMLNCFSQAVGTADNDFDLTAESGCTFYVCNCRYKTTGGLGTIVQVGSGWAEGVNTEMADVIKVDTIAEMAQGAPPVSPTQEQILNYFYRLFRNKDTQDEAVTKVYDDAGSTVLFKAPTEDVAGLFTKEKYVSGP